MTGMPPREDNIEAIPLDDAGLVVGKIPVRSVGLRIGLQANGQLVLMSPAAARRMAKKFDSPEAAAALTLQRALATAATFVPAEVKATLETADQ